MTKFVNQLIDFFVPSHYDLALDIDQVGRAFSGTVNIKGKQVGEEIRLHVKDLEISRAMINGVEAKVKKHVNDEISLSGAAVQKKVEIEIEFTGKIVDGSMHGMYPCYYEFDGEKKEWLATQFESHHAREVFPCVDEPAAKATFDLALTTESGVTVLSNMPIAQERNLHGKLTTKFMTTPKMSTYLLAWVIGDMQKFSAQTKRGVEVNVFATPAQKPESLKFASEVATKCIDFYEEYFGVNYPLPKSDHVALPDFSSGAMENWGLITYRETCLLADKNAAVASKQYIATVIAHELSHQWFGNLVTMKWWDDLWLNESFASLCEHIATDALFPDWQMWQSFETTDVVAALRRDALPGVQSVRQDVHHPDEISTLFDSAIVYAKGERLLKMCRAYLGEKTFRTGLKNYFQKFAYQNTEADDLWQCLSEASGVDVNKLMTPWLTRSGYPVVSADYRDGEVILSQERFLLEKPQIALRKLSLNDGEKELEYLRKVPQDENGYRNPASEQDLSSMSSFKKWLKVANDTSKGVGLPDGYVPQTIFYIERDNEIVGSMKMRHCLNDSLRNVGGGHIGYGGVPEGLRGQGITTKALALAIKKLRTMGEDDILITVHEDNLASRKVIEKNGGVIWKTIDDVKYPGKKEVFYWVKKSTDHCLWPIPLFSSDENCPKILDGKVIKFTPQNVAKFRLNVDNNAHYICVFSDNLRAQLTTTINDFSVIDRAATINQIALLARGGRESAADLIEVLSKLQYESSDAVWDMMSVALGDLMRFVEPDSLDEKRLKKLVENLAQRQYKRLGWSQKKNEPVGNTKLRATIVSHMIYAENPVTIKRALEIYTASKHDLDKITGDLRTTILSAAVRHGGDDEFAYLLDIYKSTSDAELRQDICAALTSTHSQEQIDEIAAFLDKVGIVRPQDLFYWYAYMLGNRRARAKTWTWTRENWSFITKTFAGDKSYDMFPRYAGQRLQTRVELTEFDDFFAPLKSEPALTRAIEIGHNDIATRVEWLERDREDVLAKLSEIK